MDTLEEHLPPDGADHALHGSSSGICWHFRGRGSCRAYSEFGICNKPSLFVNRWVLVLRKANVKEKVEYFCGCGRHFIVPGKKEGKTRKCPHCGRLMEPFDEKKQNFEQALKSPKKKNPLDNLEETIEYEYKFDESGRRVTKEKKNIAFFRFLKKIFTLFTYRPSSYRE